VLPDESGASATAFMHRALAHYDQFGVRVQLVMSDNAFAYKSRSFRRLCELSNVRQLFIKAYTPKTNGKAERRVRMPLREWAYERPYHSEEIRP
jgi:transposase InsO family protein